MKNIENLTFKEIYTAMKEAKQKPETKKYLCVLDTCNYDINKKERCVGIKFYKFTEQLPLKKSHTIASFNFVI